LVVGTDGIVKGNIDGMGSVLVDGKVEGNISADAVCLRNQVCCGACKFRCYKARFTAMSVLIIAVSSCYCCFELIIVIAIDMYRQQYLAILRASRSR
jgi:hypothetical protein